MRKDPRMTPAFIFSTVAVRTGGLSRRPRAGIVALAFMGMVVPGVASAADCTIATAPVPFGNYDPVGTNRFTPRDATGRVTATCTRTLPGIERVNYALALSTGTSGSYLVRQMANGAERLNYNLYTTAARSTVWGDGSAGTVQVTGSFTLRATSPTGSRNHTVFGRVPQAQDPAAGPYIDTITVTMIF